jgi:hypothetical protein
MEVKDVTASLKEWFFDLAGLFLPGATLIFVLNLIYKNQVHLEDISRYYTQDIKVNFAYVVTAYIAGYVVYGLSWFVDGVFDLGNKAAWSRIPSKSHKRSEIINSSNEYSLFKKLMLQGAGVDIKADLTAFLAADNFDEIRNLAMSYSPESDSKIYNFSFRAEICNHLGTAFTITAIAGLIASVLTTRSLFLFSFASFLVAVLFKLVRIKYLDAAYKVPFSIAIAKLMSPKP